MRNYDNIILFSVCEKYITATALTRAKLWRPSDKCCNINVQKLTMNSAFQQ